MRLDLQESHMLVQAHVILMHKCMHWVKHLHKINICNILNTCFTIKEGANAKSYGGTVIPKVQGV